MMDTHHLYLCLHVHPGAFEAGGDPHRIKAYRRQVVEHVIRRLSDPTGIISGDSVAGRLHDTIVLSLADDGDGFIVRQYLSAQRPADNGHWSWMDWIAMAVVLAVGGTIVGLGFFTLVKMIAHGLR